MEEKKNKIKENYKKLMVLEKLEVMMNFLEADDSFEDVTLTFPEMILDDLYEFIEDKMADLAKELQLFD